jgi:hypothetical protein
MSRPSQRFGVTAERDRRDQLTVAVGDIHTAESFPDSLASKGKRRGNADMLPGCQHA